MTQLKNRQQTWRDAEPKKISRWQVSLWEDTACHKSSGSWTVTGRHHFSNIRLLERPDPKPWQHHMLTRTWATGILTAGGNAKGASAEDTMDISFKDRKAHFAHDLEIALHIYPNEPTIYVLRKIHTAVVIVVLFKIAIWPIRWINQ